MVCLAMESAWLYGQRYSFKRYDQESGLPDQSVRCLAQDRAGFLWVGTDNGLFRYDGNRFRGFTTDDGLPSARIEAINQDGDGTLWVATYSGLARLKGDRFETVDIAPARGPVAITTDSTRRLYVGTWRGLAVAEPTRGSQKPAFELYTKPGARGQVVRSVAVSPSGEVWYACDKTLCRLDGGRVVSEGAWGVPEDLWEGVAIDGHGSVWARSRTQLIELPEGAARFQHRDAGLPPAAISGTLLVARDGQLWVPTLRGLARGEIKPTPQDASQATLAPPLTKEEGRIDWSLSAQQIYRRMRAFDPWPGTYTSFSGKACHIWGQPLVPEGGEMELLKSACGNEPPVGGRIVLLNREVIVCCGDGTALRLESAKMEGRKRVTAREFAFGVRLASGERFGS